MEEHWEGIARTVFAATHEHEEGVTRYEYWRGTDPRQYYVLLSFRSFDDFMVHQVADYHHHAPFGDCFEEFRLEWVDPVDEAAPLPRTVTSGDERADGGELWNGYVRRHSEATPAWWESLRR